MSLVVFSHRSIVTYSSEAAQVFPLRRMTSYGKRTALQVIDRLFYAGQADPIEGLKKGVKDTSRLCTQEPGVIHPAPIQ